MQDPYSQQAGTRLDEVQRRPLGIRDLPGEQRVGQHFRQQAEDDQRDPVARRIQQQECEHRARGRPEHRHAARRDQQGKADEHGQKM